MKIRVYYEDTDAGGIVYHTNYIKYCERARSEVFFAQGIVPADGNGSGFVVNSLSANFIAPAYLGDVLEIKSKILQLKKTSMLLKQRVCKDNKEIFVMEIKLAFISGGKISRIPDAFIKILEDML